MRNIVPFAAAWLAAGCGNAEALPRVTVTGPHATSDPIVVTQGGYTVKGPPPECPRSTEWDLVTWPEMEPVVARIGEAAPALWSGCEMPIVPDEPLADRWYAARWRGEVASFEPAEGAIQRRDGSLLWRFRGVTHARVTEIDTIPWEDFLFVQAAVSEPIDPAPGLDWGSLMTVSQGGLACTYPGTEVSAGSGTIGFDETLVADCTALDPSAPMHVHIEGAVTRNGGVAVPVVDLDHRFGISQSSSYIQFTEPHEEPPPCTDPRCE